MNKVEVGGTLGLQGAVGTAANWRVCILCKGDPTAQLRPSAAKWKPGPRSDCSREAGNTDLYVKYPNFT